MGTGGLVTAIPPTSISYFVKRGQPFKISILQEKQRKWSVLHITNALRGRISPSILIIIEDAVIILLCIIRGPMVECFATHNSI